MDFVVSYSTYISIKNTSAKTIIVLVIISTLLKDSLMEKIWSVEGRPFTIIALGSIELVNTRLQEFNSSSSY